MGTRLALAGEDDHFLFEVYVSSRQEEIALWEWKEEQQNQFLRMQFDCQRRYYQSQYPNLECKIIMFGGAKVGRVLTAKTGEENVLVDVTVLPEFRNKGIGTALLSELQRNTAREGRTMRLSVLKENPAQRLYERLGFIAVDNSALYTVMKWIK